MRTITISTDLYKFDELSEEAKENAINRLRDVNTDYEWHEHIKADASNIGLNIRDWDIERYVNGAFTTSADEVAESILREHGPDCETVRTANGYLEALSEVKRKCKADNPDEEEWEDFLDTNTIDNEFRRALCEDYRIMLSKEFDYQTSTEAIEESIRANDYEFTIKGDFV